ncbi:MAG: PEP-CTERM sorting domain-containing protein [Burkholderiaceae bacterium]|nr:PEP-CTERM sorting domain-containing protein [Burkholderiaceae bacterium]MBT9504343.1 PEP-CTERM sorting domain-containing protein [Burkholderiaceae bacterium]
MASLKHLVVTLLGGLSLGTATAGWVDVTTSREWLTAMEATDHTQLACNAVTGACGGAVNGFDYLGWTWATTDDVNVLFTNLGIPGFAGAGGHSTQAANSIWAPAFIDLDGIGPDAGVFMRNFSSNELNARTRGGASGARVIDSATGTDVADTGLDPSRLATNDMWLYRTVQLSQNVPEPSTPLLVALAVGAAVGVTRRGKA